MRFYFLVILIITSLNTFAKIQGTGAICLSLQTGKGFERLAYKVFASKVCGKYEKNFTIIYKHSKSSYPIERIDRERLLTFINQSPSVDIFFFGHTNAASHFFLNDLGENIKGKTRLVYNSGCLDGDEYDGYAWKQYAKVFVGHPGYNYGTKYTPFFFKKWFEGVAVEDIVRLSNARMNKAKYFDDYNDPFGYFYGDGNITINNKGQE